jgi:hypothetical protein
MVTTQGRDRSRLRGVLVGVVVRVEALRLAAASHLADRRPRELALADRRPCRGPCRGDDRMSFPVASDGLAVDRTASLCPRPLAGLRSVGFYVAPVAFAVPSSAVGELALTICTSLRSGLDGVCPIRAAFALCIFRASDAQSILALRLRTARAGGFRHLFGSKSGRKKALAGTAREPARAKSALGASRKHREGCPRAAAAPRTAHEQRGASR